MLVGDLILNEIMKQASLNKEHACKKYLASFVECEAICIGQKIEKQRKQSYQCL